MVSDLKEPVAPGGLLWEGWVFDSRLASVWSGSLCCGLSEGASITSHFTPSLLGDFNMHSRVQLFATPRDCSPPGSSVHGILQARILEWVEIGRASCRERV